MTLKTRSQPLEPIPSFNFVNRREADFVLVALQRLKDSGEVDSMEMDDFYNLLDAFQTFSLSI